MTMRISAGLSPAKMRHVTDRQGSQIVVENLPGFNATLYEATSRMSLFSRFSTVYPCVSCSSCALLSVLCGFRTLRRGSLPFWTFGRKALLRLVLPVSQESSHVIFRDFAHFEHFHVVLYGV